MTISMFAAVRETLTATDGKAPIQVFRPPAAYALEEVRAQAELGEPIAQQELGKRYYFGIGGVEQDDLTAYAWLLKAAAQDAQDAQFLIAECYRCGRGVQHDYVKYFDWLFRAAEHGSWMAMFNIAAAYHEGSIPYGGAGVEQDDAQALAWTLQAEKAIRAYWEFYENPICLDFRAEKSRLLQAYTRAAMQLSKHYAEGIGTACDGDRALYWLRRAKRFVSRAIGQTEIPMLDEAIAAQQQRRDADAVQHAWEQQQKL